MTGLNRTAVLTAAAILSAVAAAPASAQYGNAAAMNNESWNNQFSRSSTGPFNPDQDTVQSLSLYNQMLTYGRCTASTAKGLVRQALASAPDSATERFLFTDIAARSQACKGGGLVPVRTLVRGVFAEGLYHATVKTPDLAPAMPGDAAYQAFTADEVQYHMALGAADRGLYTATDCLVAQQPALAHEVLATKHGTPAEAEQMDKLFAAAPSCAGGNRQAIHNRSFLRAFLATSAYRYALFRSAETKG